MAKLKMTLLGRAGVDSGQVIVTDPCYVELKKDVRPGLEVVADTTVGDGYFPVYRVELNGHVGLFVEFGDGGELAAALKKFRP